MNPTFDDAAWSEGLACFGNIRSNYAINTQWTTNDIWLRKKVKFNGLSKEDLKNLELNVISDGVFQVYINGIQQLSVEGTGIKREKITFSDELLNTFVQEGEATIAVHINRKIKQKLFDASLTCYINGKYTPVKWAMKQGPLTSVFAKDIDVENVWGEYPRPQMVREEWQNLNGIWELQPLLKDKEGMPENAYSAEILVPFPVESPISGIMEVYDRFAYRRTFTVPKKWKEQKMI